MADNSGSQIPAGKIPSELLQRLLARHLVTDERVIIGASVGIDAAAIEFGDTTLVVKSDPITFPTPDAGYYLVNVNANDIACLGADPRWLLVTALLPEGATTESTIEELFASIARAANDLNIVLVGGHTEITTGLDRPLLSGTLLGEVSRDALLDIRTSRPGDAIILCKGIAIEGTSILASEFGGRLSDSIPEETIHRSLGFTSEPGISVVAAAREVRKWGAEVRGMHDPTEGGIVTALHEIAEATGCGLDIQGDAIEILPETAAICDALGVDPLGLIASGALLAIVDPARQQAILRSLQQAGIPAWSIGSLTESRSRTMTIGGRSHPLPEFEVDEIARLFSEADSY